MGFGQRPDGPGSRHGPTHGGVLRGGLPAGVEPRVRHALTSPPPDALTDDATLGLVRALGRALREHDVSYCHFKSNAFLDRSHDGRNDLDLLIAREDEARFAAAVHGLGFKLALREARALPGVLDYYGHDPGAAKLVHLHAHYQLIVGDDLTKNYRLPLERAFLREAQPAGELMVPPPELELILLVLRLTIKHGTWDNVAMHRGGVPKSARAELAWLEERADPARLREHLARELPSVSPELFARCRAALEPGPPSAAGLRAGSEMLRALRAYGRRSRAADLSLMTVRRTDAIAARLTRRAAPRKRLVAGGAVIALVGADGAGKSTAIEALEEWLGRTFPVTRVHLGRPPQSQTRRALTNAARARSLGRKLLGRQPPAKATEHAVLATALARDRFLTFRRARRIATNGGLVISDRFPLPQLATMDAPRVERFRHPTHFKRLTDALSALERRYYAVIAGPDVLVVLRVDPEVAVARKPEEPAEFVRMRWGEIWDVDWSQVPGAHVIDAGAPVEEVHAQIKALVWAGI